MASGQETFNPLNNGRFEWTDDGWYKLDEHAEWKALQERNVRAKELRKAGKRVVCFSLGDQLLSMGGIGTNHPHIELWMKVYGVNWYDQ